ncbi:MAG: CDP-alcohol phosphatidyltransferase [Alphaproteobacteria bacterium]|jgi:CDP-diacylglycerol--serine O-phosphatidyltransferase|nr:CDP-alcohol phosphatidyltransferase [Alphaproteobacteria bacterium]MDF3034400.1 CDP-alcohol phosphatidyltransferase [Alphaproteobacteria bacterium]
MAWKGKKSAALNSKPKKRSNLRTRLPARLAKRPLQGYSLSAMLPNIATVLALCTGLSAIRFALQERWEWCVTAILIAGILDAIDGRLARFLGSTSRFGAELDSLSDFISFGVTPALVMYFFTLHQWGGVGWAFVLLFSVCMALRLARFNTGSIEGTSPAWAAAYSTGMPAPAAAALAISPIVLSFEWPWAFIISPLFCGTILLAVAILMISAMPIYTLKKVHIPHKFVVPFMVIIVLLTATLFSKPWLMLTLMAIGYVGTIPFSIASYRKTAREQALEMKAEKP